MDPNEDIAEERLLRVIEGGGTINPDEPKTPKKGKKQSRVNPIQKLIGSIGNISTSIGRAKSIHLDLHFTNVALWVVLALIGIYLIADFVMFEFHTKQNYSERLPKSGKTLGASSESAGDQKARIKPLSEYINAFQERDPFTGAKHQEEVVEEVVEEPEVDPNSYIQGLSLVGINKGAQPEAFIEDTVLKKTYFVKAGQKVKDLLVKEVQADAVIFAHGDQEIKLTN